MILVEMKIKFKEKIVIQFLNNNTKINQREKLSYQLKILVVKETKDFLSKNSLEELQMLITLLNLKLSNLEIL